MNVVRDVCKVLIDEQGLTAEMLPESWKFCAAKIDKPWADINYKLSAGLVDMLTLLSNTDDQLARMHEINIEAVLAKVRLPQTPEWEAPRARLEVLGLQLVTVVDKPKEEPAAAEDEPPALAD